ncbi:MAG TPA: aldose 1-epimerase family protein [Acetobacteraceae bacterium]|jgi:galactose mutarotase-like enzyme
MDRHSIAGPGLSATVKADGAELCSLRGADGREMLWQAGPPWPRHAPVLFPIVGRLKDDQLEHNGRAYRLNQHGFARDRRFTWAETTPTSCRLVLEDDAESRAMYPFPFRFEVAYAIAADTLSVTFSVTNTGADTLPASMGAHPAFRWPLVDGIPKDAHRLEFAAAEPAPIRRVAGGLLLPDSFPTPIANKMLALNEGLFATDAIILDHPASQSVRYTADGGPVIEVSWDGFPELGIWSRAGADLLCIEPWRGMASPAGFDGEFSDKPGLMLIPPGEQRQAVHRIRVG